MAKESDYKKRCKKCIYSTAMYGLRHQRTVTACYYMGLTGERRGCHGSECDKFVPKRRGKKNGENQS